VVVALVATLNLGIAIGRQADDGEYQHFYIPNLEWMIAELDDHREKREIELLKEKVHLLRKNWNTIGDSDAFRVFRGEFDTLDTKTLKSEPGETGQSH
jgi:hypothetical protein